MHGYAASVQTAGVYHDNPRAQRSRATVLPLRVLLVADSTFDVGPLVDSLRRGGFEPTWMRVESEAVLRVELLAASWQIILSAFSLLQLDILRALEVAKELSPDTPFIIVSAPICDDAVEAMRAGAADYVTQENLLRLPAAVARELRQAAAHRAQRSAERRFRSLIESVPIGIVVHRDGHILYANPISLRYLGIGRLDDLLGRDPLELVVAEDRGRLGERLVRIHVGQSVPPIETELLRADGTTLPIEVVGFRLDFDGEPAIVTLARDITHERDMQRRLMVADRMVSIGTLAAGVAHEINNPIAYVQGNVEFALEKLSRSERGGEVIEEVREALLEAREGASRVRLIVRDLKTFSRPEEERLETIDLRPVLESAINIAFSEIRHRARLVKELGSAPLVAASGARLGQVFLNMLVNAAQAIPEGAADRNEIKVSTLTDEQGRAVVAIADTGAGIAPEVRRRIFDPFFSTKPIGVGTGLGLTICQRIVSSLGGEIDVRSELGRGTEFRVVLPAAELEAAPHPREPPVEEEGRRGKILSIDDDPLMGNSIKRVLDRHEVVAMQSARAALADLAAGNRYDLILCDLMMPEMSGMELHAELLEMDPGLAARMIFLTSGAFTPAAQRFLDRVANLRLEKPFNAADLRAVVRNQLG
jgi:PAS domain S-box-containing protein